MNCKSKVCPKHRMGKKEKKMDTRLEKWTGTIL